MREAETYRDHLEDILQWSGGMRLLTVTQAARYLGRSREWVRKQLGVTGVEGISAIKLARWLSR